MTILIDLATHRHHKYVLQMIYLVKMVIFQFVIPC